MVSRILCGRQINQRRHNSSLSLVGLSIIHPRHCCLVGLHSVLLTLFKTQLSVLYNFLQNWTIFKTQLRDCTPSFHHRIVQNHCQDTIVRIVQFSSHTCGIIHASNSPKPLVVPWDPPCSNPLNLSRITDEKLTFPFICLLSSNNQFVQSSLKSNPLYHRNSQITAGNSTLLLSTFNTSCNTSPIEHLLSNQNLGCDPTINFPRVPINFKIFLPKPG